jgi:hypothetical protein
MFGVCIISLVFHFSNKNKVEATIPCEWNDHEEKLESMAGLAPVGVMVEYKVYLFSQLYRKGIIENGGVS